MDCLVASSECFMNIVILIMSERHVMRVSNMHTSTKVDAPGAYDNESQ